MPCRRCCWSVGEYGIKVRFSKDVSGWYTEGGNIQSKTVVVPDEELR